MPELPEVETIVRQLRPELAGRHVRSLRVLDPTCVVAQPSKLAGRTVGQVRRMGKQVVVGMTDGTQAVWMAVHLRMTGRLLWIAGDHPSPPPGRVRAELVTDAGVLHFVDTRRLGTVTFTERVETLEPAGIDPTGPLFTADRLARLLRGSGQDLKVWLLRQDRLCGFGNIYASETLFRARLNPWRRADGLDGHEVARLHRATVEVFAEAIDNCGTTFSDFQGAFGVTGSYQRFLAVYRRQDQPCQRCATPIRRRVQQARSTFYCPTCQPDPAGLWPEDPAAPPRQRTRKSG